ncbi:MAG: class I SAM-dependent methyltransferase [Actinomycetota bacterium]
MDDDERERLGATFDRDAAGYDAGRPDYPPRAWDLVLDHLGLDDGDRVLEIGPATGQATGRLLASGAHVHAVEPGTELAALLRRRFDGERLEVEIAPFESAVLRPPYDAIAAATSFHWVDPDVGVPRLREALAPGGRLALWWNIHRDPDAAVADPIDTLVRSTTRLPNTRGLDGILDELALPERLRTAGFTDVRSRVVRWTITHDEASIVALFRSFSDMRSRSAEEQARVYDALRTLVRDHGGTIERPATTPVLTATRAGDPTGA